MSQRKKAEDRLLTMAELADLLGIAGQWRCKQAARLFRRLEQRDGESYLERPGPRKLYVRLSTVDRLLPWSPGTIAGIRRDVSEIGDQMSTLRKRVNSHGARLRNVEAIQKLTQDYVAATGRLMAGTNGP